MSRNKQEIPTFRIIRRTDSKYWFITWSENRRSRRISTGTTNEAEAKRQLAQHIEGWQTPVDEEKTVFEAIESYLRYKEPDATTKQALRNFDKTKSTLTAINNFFGDYLIKDIKRFTVRSYIKQRRELGYSDGTTRKQLNLLTAALNHVRKEGWIEAIPHIDKPSSPKARDKWMEPEQVTKLLKSCVSPHIRLFALLALHTLSRKGAILDLTWDRVDFKNKRIDFNLPDMPENNKRRVIVPITSNTLISALKEAKELAVTNNVIEYAESGVFDMRRGFEAAAKRADLPWVTPHVLRHTGASLLAQNGVALMKIAELMGDNPTTVYRNYVKFTPSFMDEATSVLDKLYG